MLLIVIPSQVVNQRYRLLSLIGTGGMGVVYQAIDRLNGQAVALKLVSQKAVDRLDTTEPISGTMERLSISLAHEFQVLASLRHPNIISVLDYGFYYIDGRAQIYYTMELLSGARTILDAGQTRTTIERIDLLAEVCQALIYLHRRGVLHRDLKPENILVTNDGVVKVLDFGLALLHAQDANDPVGGTLAYLAPEVLRGGAASESSDLYALGMIAYELLCGHPPFPRSNPGLMVQAILTTLPDLMPLLAIETAITPTNGTNDLMISDRPSLSALIAGLLAKDPDERPASALELMRALYSTTDRPLPVEPTHVRDSFLQAAAFVGRDAEMTTLIDAFNAMLAGQGSTC